MRPVATGYTSSRSGPSPIQSSIRRGILYQLLGRTRGLGHSHHEQVRANYLLYSYTSVILRKASQEIDVIVIFVVIVIFYRLIFRGFY